MLLRRIMIVVWLGAMGFLCIEGVIRAAELHVADGLLQELRSQTGAEREQTAMELVRVELATSSPRPSVLVQAWGLLRGRPQAGVVRSMIEARVDQDLERELIRRFADAEKLHVLWEIAAIVDSEWSASLHVRIASRAGDRSAAAAQLSEAAAELMSNPLPGDAQAIAAAWSALRHAGTGPHWLTWAAQQTPPQQRAIADARAALAQALIAQLDTQAIEAAQQTWKVLHELGTDEIPVTVVAQYAAAVRYRELPTMAIISCAVITLFLFGGLSWCFSVLVRGRRLFDAGAETIENIEPIEFETDVVTIQREATSEETRVD